MEFSKNMNIQDLDIMNMLSREPYANQRLLAERSGHSLGIVNRSLRALTEQGFLDGDRMLTEKARRLLEAGRPKNAVILAAGAGMRMAPINTQTPKGLLEVHGEPLIERIIGQLRQAGVREISLVVGYMMEQYEYLIDKFGVELIANGQYAVKNNLHSLALAAERLGGTYVVPGDLWCAENPFSDRELYSWYMVSDREDDASTVRVTRKRELAQVPPAGGGNAMIGISYLMGPEAETVRRRLRSMDRNGRYDGCFWEETLYEQGKMLLSARVVPAGAVVEINTYEQLRELDSGSAHLRSDAITTAARVLGAVEREIRDIQILKKGMTNRSFVFSCRGRRYIMRVPGEGTDKLIDRHHEAAVYRAIRGKGLCDEPVYLDPDTGYKITYYIENIRCCDPNDEQDLVRCMEKLRSFHRMGLSVEHQFDIFRMIDYYESLWEGTPSVYRDYEQTKRGVLELKEYVYRHGEKRVLTHIDAVPDNFLFEPAGDLQLTDWEYAGMQDPHVDIAMFCVYSLYDRAQVDRLIDIYFEGACPDETRLKIYCYVAVCGLLWSNWCEYKRKLGVEFGEYALRQYRYAKDYARLARRMMEGGA